MNWSSLTSANQFFWWLVSANSSTITPSFISRSRLVAGLSWLFVRTALNNAPPSPWTRYENHCQFSLFLGWRDGSVTLGNAMGSMGSTFPTWRLYFGWSSLSSLIQILAGEWSLITRISAFPRRWTHYGLWILRLTLRLLEPDKLFMQFTVLHVSGLALTTENGFNHVWSAH